MKGTVRGWHGTAANLDGASGGYRAEVTNKDKARGGKGRVDAYFNE